VRCVVITISDTRTAANDTSGDAIAELLAGSGHVVAARRIVPDDPAQVRDAVQAAEGVADVVITTGGTGIAARDTTFEAIQSLLGKRIEGFGELFRVLSFQEIGAAAMLSRATAGAMGRVAVFTLPGSEHAVRLAMTKLILPEIGHVVRELHR
jgi:molybdenum cofactor biosynthesis protein B